MGGDMLVRYLLIMDNLPNGKLKCYKELSGGTCNKSNKIIVNQFFKQQTCTFLIARDVVVVFDFVLKYEKTLMIHSHCCCCFLFP